MSEDQTGTCIDVSQVYNSQSNDSVAQNCEPEIKLTKFNTLNADFESQAKQNFKGTLSVDQLTKINNHSVGSNNNKWPWFLASKKDSVSFNNLTDIMPYQSGILGGEKQVVSTVAGHEHFVVIWKRLSFQVDISLYDRAINRLGMGLFKDIWPLATKSTTKPQQQQIESKNFEANISSDELSKSSSSVDSESASSVDSFHTINSKRTIFEDLNGFIKSGEISAILGPSGSGKTSLLNAICGKVENYRGKIQLIGGGLRRMRLSIIPQKDYLIENLTVKENLLFSSKILNTNKDFNHESHIMNIVRMLNLTSCLESSVLNISGGEYKRVSIAQELLKQPDLLILDEPTSGLDSLNCKNLIKSLAQLIDASRKGTINPIAIVMTIHQPDIDVFQLFDHVYCMAKNGRVIYDGHPSDVMEILNSQLKGLISNLEPTTSTQKQMFSTNPANLLIEIASENIYGREVVEKLARYQRKKFELEMSEADYTKNKLSPKQLHEQLITILNLEPIISSKSMIDITNGKFGSNNSSNNNLSTSLTLSSDSSLNQPHQHQYHHHQPQPQSKTQEGQLVRDKRLNAKKDNQGNFWYHTNILARRAFKSTIRDSLMTIISLLFHLSMPLVMWTVFSERIGTIKACPIIQRELDMVSMISNKSQDRMNELKEEMVLAIECTVMLYLITYSFSMCSIAVTALAFPLNMHILLKEVKNGWYNLPSFVIAKTIANFPFEILFPVISLMLTYILLGMPSSYFEWRFWGMALVMALISVISHTHGLIFGAICMDSVETAIFMAISSTLPLTLLSGFTARIKNMPKLLQHMSWLSPYRYSSDALNILRFGYGICPCDQSTVDYLKTEQANLSDIPQNMKPLFTYYLTNTASEPQNEPTTTTPLEIVGSTIASVINSANETFSNLTTANDIINSTSLSSSSINIRPLGVSDDLKISQLDRAQLLSKIETNEIDLFQKLADLMSRSFTYGRELTTCDTVRSEVLVMLGTPNDNFLPYLFLGLVTLLIVSKILLFVIVKYRIGKRI